MDSARQDGPGRPRNPVESWIGHLQRRPVAVVSWTAALLVAGAWVATRLPFEWVPSVRLHEVTIRAAWPGASPETVERYVTAPLERAIQGVPGTADIHSYSLEGESAIRLEVLETRDLGAYVTELGDRLALLRHRLPADVHPRLDREIPEALRDEQGFMTLQLIGESRPDRLRGLAEQRLGPKLRSLPGVAGVRIEGGTERELRVSLIPERLVENRIRAELVRDRLREATSGASYGRLDGTERSALLLTSEKHELDELRRLVIARTPGDGQPVRLADLARVELTQAPVRSISRVDGKPVVTLVLDRTPGSHMLRVAEHLRARCAELRTELPPGVDLLVADDRSSHARYQLRQLAWQGGCGVAIILLVLVGMLRGFRATAIVLFSVGVALAVAALLLYFADLTLNLLTLAGLVLIFGLLVDNAAVMVEQLTVQRSRLSARLPPGPSLELAASVRALHVIWVPLLGSTLTTMAVLVPFLYMSRELRGFFVPLVSVICLTLVFSLLSTSFLLPVLSSFLPAARRRQAPRRRMRRLVELPLRWVARWPVPVLLALALTFGLPVWLLPERLKSGEEPFSAVEERAARLYNATLGRESVVRLRPFLDAALGGISRLFFENVELGQRWGFAKEPEVMVRLAFQSGSDIERLDALMVDFERSALASSAVRRTMLQVDERVGWLRVQFTKDSLLTAEPLAVRERLIDEALDLAGLQVSVRGLLPLGYFSGTAPLSQLIVEAHGPTYEGLDRLIGDFAARLRENPRVNDVTAEGSLGGDLPREQLRLRWGADAVALSGVTAEELTADLRSRLAVRSPRLDVRLEDEDKRLPMRVLLDGADRVDIADLMHQTLPLGRAGGIRLAELSELEVVRQPGTVERLNQQYRRYVQIDFRGPVWLGEELIDRELRAMTIPPGYRLEQPTFRFFTRRVQRELIGILLLTLGAVFLVMVGVFESWRIPLVVLLSVPLAFLGVAGAFLAFDAFLAEGTFIGAILLVGIAVNDNILLVYRYRQLRAARPTAGPAILARLAVRHRFRPMWTTTLSTVGGLLPLVALPEQAGFWFDLALTVGGGLLTSTLLAPVAVVALLSFGKKARPA